MDLGEVGQLGKAMLVAQRNVDEAVVSEGAHGGNSSGLLTTTESTGGDEQTSVLARVATSGPDGARGIPEGLPLSGEVTVTGGDTEQDGIVLQKVVGLSNGVVGLGRGVHLGQDLLGEGLGDPAYIISETIRDQLDFNQICLLEDIGLATSSLNTLLLSLGQGLDVAVHRVL